MVKKIIHYLPIVIAFGAAAAWLFVSRHDEERHDSDLLRAINAGDVQSARKAFSEGATMHMPIRRHATFLHVAARQGSVEMAKLLVEHGAPVQAINDDGATALDIAIANVRTDMANYLRPLTTTNATEPSKDLILK